MQRQMLRLTLVLGVMVTLLGGTGVFAVFSDQASGGPNTVTSGALASAADLRIAPATASQIVSCGQYQEDTTTSQFTVVDFNQQTAVQRAYVCLSNAGSAPLDLTLQASFLRDLDTGCTGDEAAAGDATCGANGLGELSFVTSVDAHQVNCMTLARTGGLAQTLDRWGAVATSFAAPQLAPGAIACIEFELRYSSAATETQVQVAQSDQVTWNFRFEGTAS